MNKYTDDEIRNMKKITCQIAADYLGISVIAVRTGMRYEKLPIGFAIKMKTAIQTVGAIILFPKD